MDINSAVLHFYHLVKQFNSHKDFTSEGNKIFKVKQNQLIQFSKNVNSLPVCLIVLENSNQISPLYFASQFVKDKLKYQFQQLTSAVIEDTHARIINLIRSNRNWSKIIRNNFALCLAYLYIHCHDQLGSVLNFYSKTFQIGDIFTANLGQVQYQYLFRYLDGLACEIDNKRLVIDQIKRHQVQKDLKNQQKEIIMFLHHIYSHISTSSSKPNIDDVEKLLFSFSQWIRIGELAPQITQQLHNHSLFQLAISHLSDQELTQAAKQCILNAIQQIKNPDQSPQFYDFMGKNLSSLINSIMKQIKDQDYDQAENFIKVLCEYGKHAGKNIIENFNQSSLSFIQKMIIFTEHPMLQSFKDLCDFWQDFIFFIQSRHDKSKLTKPIADQIIVKLYQTFCDKIMYNPTQISQLNQLSERQLQKLHQSVEDVRQRRQQARYMFQSIGNYFRYQNFIHEVIKLIFDLDKNSSEFWSKIQAYVFSIRDVAKKYVKPTPQICSLVLFFQELKDKPIILLKSILRLFQSLLTMQQKNQQFILRILNNIALMFQKELLDQKTGQAFQKCCQKNASVLIKYLGPIYELLNVYPNKDSILIGITYILKENPSILTQNLPLIFQKPLELLKNTKSKRQQRNIFNKLLAIIQCIPKGQSKDLNQIIEMLFKQMWPIIQHIISYPQDPFNGQDKLIERAVKFIKLVMRSIPDQFVQYLNPVFSKVIESYKKFPINSFVYIYEVAFTVYYKSHQAELLNFIKALYIQYCTITYNYLTKPSQIANFEHLVDDFVGLNKRIITYDTRMFFESGQVQPILKFSTHCLGSGVPRAASTASQLFQIIFMIYWSPYSRQQYQNKSKGEVVIVDSKNESLYAELKNFLLPVIPNLLRQMFKFLQIGPVQSARDNILDCFQAIALAFPKQSRIIWSQPLDELGEDILTITQKQRFKQNLQKIGSNDHLQFVNAQYTIGKLLYTAGTRYLYRKSRAKSLSNNL